MDIASCLKDPSLFGQLFPLDDGSWSTWRVFLTSLYGLPLSEAERSIFTARTGRTDPPTAPVRECWVIAGRRGGKTFVSAVLAVAEATLGLIARPVKRAPGEVLTVALIGADRAQARSLYRYASGVLDAVPILGKLVTRRTADSIELDGVELGGPVVIEVATASARTTRGYSFLAVIGDEVAFWRNDETSTDNASEVLAALRPGLATTGGLLLCISTPYSRRGATWESFRRHYGKEGSPVLVWTGASRDFNPSLPESLVDAALAEDEAAASAEWLGLFRKDVDAFISAEVIDACTVPNRHEVPPLEDCRHFAFCDPAGGSGTDSMTLAIAHEEHGLITLDVVREVPPPFSPDAVVADFAELLTRYRCTEVVGDRYAGEWPRERFAVHGIAYQLSERTKSDIYRDALPLLNGHRLALLDNPRLRGQLLGLERKTTRAGRDSIDHGPNGHDDVCNAAMGALLAASVVTTGEVLGLSLAPQAVRRSLDSEPSYEDEFAALARADDESIVFGMTRASG